MDTGTGVRRSVLSATAAISREIGDCHDAKEQVRRLAMTAMRKCDIVKVITFVLKFNLATQARYFFGELLQAVE
jgi:hypothetical protein